MFEKGARLGTGTVGEMRFGASICYDLRFPERYAATASTCNTAVVIANWPQRRVAHWRTLLVARAIENQFFMLGVKRAGTDGVGLSYEKSGLVVAPDGDVVEPVLGRDELDIYEIDVEEAVRYRTEFPTVRDKRPALYRELFGAASC